MTRLPGHRDAHDGDSRFAGQHALGERGHWDEATSALILERTQNPPRVTFFTAEEEAVVSPMLDRLVGQDEEGAARVPLINPVDGRLAAGETDGWHHADLPADSEVWRRTARFLDEDARERHGSGFATSTREQQEAILEAVHRTKGAWHGMPAGRLWDLWLRYACTAFYSFPSVWDEMGFPGPAYPRGYSNLGLDRRERFEVRDRGSADRTP